MLIVNIQEIKKGILSNKFPQFLIEFPEAKAELEKFKAQPSCGACERNIIPKLFSNPKFDEKMKLIYGDDITIDKTLPPIPPPMNMISKVFRIPLQEWETWFIDFNKPSPERQIRFMTTFLDNGEVVCSVHMLEIKK